MNDGASFIMHSGAITKNKRALVAVYSCGMVCHFEMTGGEISSNKAKDPDKTDDSDGPLRAHEGGGILLTQKDTKITGGSIINNETETTTDWGGGGIYINNNGTFDDSLLPLLRTTALLVWVEALLAALMRKLLSERRKQPGGQLESSAAVFRNTASGNIHPFEYGAAVQCSCVCCFFW